jgi:hypothetical protein
MVLSNYIVIVETNVTVRPHDHHLPRKRKVEWGRRPQEAINDSARQRQQIVQAAAVLQQ